MTENAFSVKRIGKLALMLFASILLPAVCGVLHNVRLDHLIIWVFLSLIFFLCFALYVERERLFGNMSRGISNDYSLLLFIYLICLAAACAGSLLPAFSAPVMAIGLLCNSAFRTKMGTALGVYFALLTALFSDGGTYELVAYILLTLVSLFLLELYLQETLRLWVSILVVCLSVIIPVCCNYLVSHQPEIKTLMISFAGSVVSLAVLHRMPKLCARERIAEEISLDTIMDEHYHLHREIERYSTVDYNHALRTSQVAAHLAAGIGADEKLARAGGFYYRIGKLEGEPFIENGVRLAQENCFSGRLVEILEEYNGQNRLPGSIESAIVQIADMIVTKFDLLDKDTFSSTWNRDIVIYQSMNEKSAEGLYDRSGLSMNQFLTIRELLVKEEILV
ncbi:MAG: hypothetical protein PUK75_04885 [bacterium]|nr:hypothetical protein [bacterium]MDY4098906.1 hypothetical protein [Lachnospiraceae bacterium]